MLFTKKQDLSTDFAQLSVGRVNYYVLKWGAINKAFKKSTVVKDVINNAIFLDCIEDSVVVLSKKERSELSVEDGLALRAKTQEILFRLGVLKEAKRQLAPVDELSEDDRRVQDQQYQRIQAKIAAMNGGASGAQRHPRG